MKKGITFLSLICLVLFTIVANADSFSLKNTKTSLVYGSFENKRGTRFYIDGKCWCIMSARPGQILFANYPATTYYGPYDFKNGHIIKLGNDAFEITSITSSAAQDPATIQELNTISHKASAQTTAPIIQSNTNTHNNQQVQIATPKIQEQETIKIVDAPQLQTRELAPAPTTNPADYKEPELFDFKMEKNPLPRTGRIWIEPINSSKYNWKIGSFNGEKDSEIERKRIGLYATYNGWFAEVAYSLSGKTSGTLVPNGSTLSDLKLDGGKGYMFRGGYNYRFTIDGNWNGSFRAMLEYAKEDYDLTASSFQLIENTYNDMYDEFGNLIENPEYDNPLASYGYVNTSSSISISEKTLSFGFGIDRTTDLWGIGFELGFVAYSDLTSSGSITVGSTDYDLEAERSHPIICEFSGWFKPVDYLYVFSEIYLGSDKGLRLGIGKEF